MKYVILALCLTLAGCDSSADVLKQKNAATDAYVAQQKLKTDADYSQFERCMNDTSRPECK